MIDFNNILSGITSDYLGFIDNLNLMIKPSIRSNDELNESLRYVFDIINKNNEKENKMTNFKDVIFEKYVAIQCPEEWMANELLKYADSNGYKWATGDSYNNITRWSIYKEDSCYNIYNGAYDAYSIYIYSDCKILHYNDVVIKDETLLDYELIIKGRKAEIGSELWYKDEEWIENIFITGIFISNKTRRINYKSKNRTGVIDVETMGDSLFWEKPIIYQLPDTEGNLSEVKVGQEVWVKYENSATYDCTITKFNGGDIEIMFICDNGEIYVSNKEGLSCSGAKVTTNKPHRDFSDCPHWEENLNAKYWGVDKKGESYFYEAKPTVILDYGYFVGWASDKHAGFRQDLLNENGAVEGWEYSLVKRPNNK